MTVKREDKSLQVLFSPFHLVFQSLPVHQLFQEPPVFLACLGHQQSLGIPQAPALQWLYLEAQVLLEGLVPHGPPLGLYLQQIPENPGQGTQQGCKKSKNTYHQVRLVAYI